MKIGKRKLGKPENWVKKVVFGRLGFSLFFWLACFAIFREKKSIPGEFGGMRGSLGRVRVGTTQDPKNTHHGTGKVPDVN